MKRLDAAPRGAASASVTEGGVDRNGCPPSMRWPSGCPAGRPARSTPPAPARCSTVRAVRARQPARRRSRRSLHRPCSPQTSWWSSRSRRTARHSGCPFRRAGGGRHLRPATRSGGVRPLCALGDDLGVFSSCHLSSPVRLRCAFCSISASPIRSRCGGARPARSSAYLHSTSTRPTARPATPPNVPSVVADGTKPAPTGRAC